MREQLLWKRVSGERFTVRRGLREPLCENRVFLCLIFVVVSTAPAGQQCQIVGDRSDCKQFLPAVATFDEEPPFWTPPRSTARAIFDRCEWHRPIATEPSAARGYLLSRSSDQLAMQNRCRSPRMNSSLSTGAGVASTVSFIALVATISNSGESLITTILPLRPLKKTYPPAATGEA